MTLEIGKNNEMLKPDMFYSVPFGSKCHCCVGGSD